MLNTEEYVNAQKNLHLQRNKIDHRELRAIARELEGEWKAWLEFENRVTDLSESIRWVIYNDSVREGTDPFKAHRNDYVIRELSGADFVESEDEYYRRQYRIAFVYIDRAIFALEILGL